jgi:hypothetical protein
LDVVLGVAVTGRVAQLALVGSAAAGHDVVDQSVVDLADNPVEKLTETVVGTNRLLADENHRLVATRLCWSDHPKADQLRRALEDSGVQNVVVLSESQAATAMWGTERHAANVPLETSDDSTVALARGAAMAAGLAADATAMAPAVGGTDSTGQVGSEWAYSASDPEPEDDEEAETGPLRRLAAADVVLGIAVAGSIARLALVGPAAGGYAAIKHSVVDLAINPFETLIRAVADTQQSLVGEHRRLVATRLYSPDQAQAEALSQALAGSGVGNVALISEAEAVTALLRGILGIGALPGSVVLQVTAEAATLLGLGAAGAPATVLAAVALEGVVDAATAAVDMLLDFLRTAPFEVTAAYVMGTLENLADVVDQLRAKSPLRVELLDDPAFAIARGAAVAPAVGLAGDATAMAPATQLAGDATAMAPTAGMPDARAEEPQLAYSMTDDGEPLPVGDEFGDEYYGDDEAQTTAQRLSGRSLLISNAVVAFAVIGFASLAVAVAVSVRPTAASEPVVGHQNAAPGKFMPLLPTQQQAPVPSPPADQPNAGFQGGIIPDANGYIPPQLMAPGGGGAPAAPAPVPASPGGPGTPGFVPKPNGPIPIPIPIIIPYPGWRPPYPPVTTTPITTTPITTTPPTTTQPHVTTTPPTTTPPHVTTTPPTTTPPHVTTTPPPSSKAPYTSTQAPTTAAPPSAPHTTVAPPHVQTQQTVAPKPVTPQQPVNPQLPHGGHH